jgi:hypothetical protein
MKRNFSIVLFTFLLLSFTAAENNAFSQSVNLENKFDNLGNFTQKGSWIGGGTISLESSNTDEKNQLIKYVNEDKVNNFALKVDGGYAFRDNTFVGLGILYGQSSRTGKYENSDGDQYNEQMYGNRISFTPFLKNLTPIDKKGRFSIITQIEFWNQLDQGITQTDLKGELTRKQTSKYTALLGVRPGIGVFVIKNVSVETTLNVAGIRYSTEKTEITDQPVSSTRTASIDFKIDLLQLNLGIFVYINPEKK